MYQTNFWYKYEYLLYLDECTDSSMWDVNEAWDVLRDLKQEQVDELWETVKTETETVKTETVKTETVKTKRQLYRDQQKQRKGK